jgi:hypothetical protein
MLIKYTLTTDDLLAWYQYLHFELSEGKQARSRFGLTRSAIILALGIAAAAFIGQWLVLVVAVVAAVASPFYFWSRYDAHIHAQFGTFVSQLEPLCGAHELTVTGDGLHNLHPLGESRLSWNSFSNCATVEGRLFIVMIIGSAYIINSTSYSGPVPFSELPEAIKRLRPATTS